jgi:hypothetical protein
MEGPPTKKSKPSQDDNQEGDSNPDGENHNDNPIDCGSGSGKNSEPSDGAEPAADGTPQDEDNQQEGGDGKPADGTQDDNQQKGGNGDGSTDKKNGSDGSASEDDGYEEEVQAGESTFLSSFPGCMQSDVCNYLGDSEQTISMDAWIVNRNYGPGGSRFLGSVEHDFHPRIFGSVCSSAISSKSDWSNTPIHFEIPSYVVIPPRYIQCMQGRSKGNCQI